MYYGYRRNADADLRDLERAYYQGDLDAFGRLVAAQARAGILPLQFLINHPEAFEYLPPEWQEQLRIITGAEQTPSAAQEFANAAIELQAALCQQCQVSEHDVCPLIPGCPCCEDTLENMDDEEAGDEEEVEDEDEELEAAKEAGLNWECSACGDDDLYEGNRGEIWEILTEASAAVTNAKIGRGEAGAAMCEDCLNQAGLDLEEAREEELEDYCLECGESLEDCECTPNRYY